MMTELSYRVATSFWQRCWGLIGQTDFEPLLIPHCRAVHTFGMRAPLDLLWLDQDFKLLRMDHNVPPNRVRFCRQAVAVFECRAGTGKTWEDFDFTALKPASQSFRQDQSGQALVETALVLPILIVLVLGFIQLGLAMSEQQRLLYTANYATQVGSITNDDLRVTGAVEEFYSADEITVAINNFDGATGSAITPNDRLYSDVMTVQLTHPFDIKIPFISLTVLDLRAEASARIICHATSLNPTCS